ncbi:hypothetical protein LJC01_01405 [Clostridiaceae bacterium OttesenSCG-928-D20]|nr:hypothetical protein [Clostridiaceae bacterium OttesenSCG-928-D20]
MIIHTMNSELKGAKAEEFFDFMLNPIPEIYKHWLPEEHHEFYIVKRGESSPVGDLVFYDQHISKAHRLKFHAIVRIAENERKIVYQMRKFGINLPGYLDLEFHNAEGCLLLREEIRIGFNGIGKILDPIIRLFFNKSFFTAMNSHHKREWSCLAELLAGEG